jgi:hypothetical protein
MRWLNQLPGVLLVTSVPLFFTRQLNSLPAYVHGLPFVALWTSAVVAALLVPLLLLLEGGTCAWLLARRAGQRSKMSWHITALLVGIAAEAVFIIARMSGR